MESLTAQQRSTASLACFAEIADVLGWAQVAPAGFRFTENCLSGPSAICSVQALVVCSLLCSCDRLFPFPRPKHATNVLKAAVARCSPTQVNEQASSYFRCAEQGVEVSTPYSLQQLHLAGRSRAGSNEGILHRPARD